jgi:SRSO17 transposase
MDAGYGANTHRHADLSALGLAYVAGILPHSTVWAAGQSRCVQRSGLAKAGRPPKLIRRNGKHRPVSVKALALNWPTIPSREGSAEPLIPVAHRDYNLSACRQKNGC